MKYRLLIVAFLLFALSGCKNGAGSISELAGMIFDALKSGKEKKLGDIIPSRSDVTLAYQLYYPDEYDSKAAREKAAAEKAASQKMSLTLAFRQVMKEAKEKGIDWKKAKLLDLKYTVRDHTEGFKDGKVRLIIDSNVGKNVVVFETMESEKRWFLVETLKWEE
jgi:uncharacterized NAD(P)/FAD-binding protein YdhS